MAIIKKRKPFWIFKRKFDFNGEIVEKWRGYDGISTEFYEYTYYQTQIALIEKNVNGNKWEVKLLYKDDNTLKKVIVNHDKKTKNGLRPMIWSFEGEWEACKEVERWLQRIINENIFKNVDFKRYLGVWYQKQKNGLKRPKNE